MKFSFNNTNFEPFVIERFPDETPIYDNLTWTGNTPSETPVSLKIASFDLGLYSIKSKSIEKYISYNSNTNTLNFDSDEIYYEKRFLF